MLIGMDFQAWSKIYQPFSVLKETSRQPNPTAEKRISVRCNSFCAPYKVPGVSSVLMTEGEAGGLKGRN